MNKEALAKQDSAMQELRANLIRVKAEAASTKTKQDGIITATEAKVQSTSIELVSMVHTFKLKVLLPAVIELLA